MKYTYETIGSSSYLAATFEGGQGIVNYQLQMVTNNDIKNIIKANKRQRNDDVIISYNITSKISLEQLCTKTKITEAGVICIIEGALSALEDIAEYQLVGTGILFDEKYIYVKPGSYQPSFVYLPCFVEDSGIEPLKKLLISLVVGSKVEITNDNFVQILLETLNNPALTADDLRQLCQKFKSKAASAQTPVKAEVKQQVKESAAVQSSIPQAPVLNDVSNVPQTQPQMQKQEIPQKADVPPTAVSSGGGNKSKGKTQTGKAKNGAAHSSKKLVFVVLQAALAAVIAGLAVSGVLNENGALSIKYLLGVLLTAACADIIIFREMFINNKDKQKSVSANNNTDSSSISSKRESVPPKKAEVKNVAVPKGNSFPDIQEIPQPAVRPIPQPVTPKAVQPPAAAPVQFETEISGYETDDTVVLDEVSSSCPYLEYYENGLLLKIRLDKDSVTVGKLSSHCDFAINNNKISKIHAEFVVRGGGVFVKDCNSTNGTYINVDTQRITSNVEYQIFNGYRITLANVDLTLKC